MKKSLLALAALTAFAGAASAQSSVTLFGIVDLSVNSIKNGPNTQRLLSSDMMNSNRLGFRGIEDLGGGLKAGFWLEAGMAPDLGNAGGGNGLVPATGQSTLFNRRATVSLLGNFGEVRLGRDYDPTFNNRASFDPFGFNGIAHMGLVESQLGSGVVSQVRVNNAVSYFLPAMGGLYGQFQVAAGENQPGQKYMGARLGYAAGPFNIGVSTAKSYKTGAMVADYKETNFGASFNLGFMTIEGTYDKHDYGASNQKHAMLGLLVPMGAGTLKASYNKASGSINTPAGVLVQDQGATLFGIGYQYDLSKRTALYATLSRLTNAGSAATGAKFVVSGGPALTAGGQTSEGYNFGIRHMF